MATRQRGLFLKRRAAQTGFALPTVLIASVVMLTVLAVTVSATSSIRVSLKEQYYSQLAQAAGDAGIAYAKACLAANGNIPTWSDANPLRPNTNCSGTVVGGYPSTVSSNGDVVSTFSVGLPTTDSNGRAVTIPNSGYVHLLRTSTGEIWKTYTQPTTQAAVVPDLCSGAATGILGWQNAVLSDLPGSYPITGSKAQVIEVANGNTAYPGPLYFRKDFSVTKSGTYELSAKAGAAFTVLIDGKHIVSGSSGSGSTTTASANLSAGCHTMVIVAKNNGVGVPDRVRLSAALRASGSSNDIVATGTSWRVDVANTVPFSSPNFYMTNSWEPVRDINLATAYSGSWTTASGDAWARFISTTHSYSGANYPAAQYAYFRDYRTVKVSSPTQVNLTTLCDDQCEVFLDGELVQKSIGSTNLFTTGITLSEGTHQFAVRLYNSTLSASGFALSVVRTSDNEVLARSDSLWLAADAWTASALDYASYDKTFSPNPAAAGFAADVELLVVAGGGSGGTSNSSNGGSGGGGAGGVIYYNAYNVQVGQSFPITIGAGGTAVAAVSTAGNSGQNTTFGSLVALGGGGGGRSITANGGSYGGSGGGGGFQAYSGSVLGSGGVVGQGNRGGASVANNNGGGGGGAGGVGANTNPAYVGVAGGFGGSGGAGLVYTISGSSVTYGRGGDGSQSSLGNVAQHGAANTGAGGSSAPYGGAGSGAGGSGVVIVSYPEGSITATGGSITTSGGKTIHRFTSNGTFTVTSIN